MPPHVVQKLLNYYTGACTTKDRDGNTPLHSAVEVLDSNVYEVVKMILKVDTNACTYKDNDGQFPVHSALKAYVKFRAIIGGQLSYSNGKLLQSIAALLEANQSAAKDTSFFGASLPLLHHIDLAEEKALEVVKVLAKYDTKTIDLPIRGHKNAVHFAVMNSTMEIAHELLLKRGELAKLNFGSLLIHCVVSGYPGRSAHNSLKMIEMLVDIYQPGLQVEDSHGDLPIHIACRNMHISADVLSLMLRACPATARVEDKNKKIPLRIAFEVGQSEANKAAVTEAWPDAQEFMFGKERGEQG
jgi:hypothetical protein